MPLTYVELFAGAGGLSLGLEAAGFQPMAHCEIEPHARAVLRHRWPGVPLFGDVTAVDGTQFAGVTLVSGGSPCQDLSVAGKRAGLAGARSGLFHQQVRIWRESGAPYFLWENVLGALSSNHGRDFAAVLSTIVGATIPVPADGWRGGGVAAGRDAVAAWRVLDLQHFGPPQRRVRVFIVAARTGGVDPAEVLALSEGVCGHPSPRQQARERFANGAGSGVEGGSGITIGIDDEKNASHELMGTLKARTKSGGSSMAVLALNGTDTVGSLLARGDSSPCVDRGQPAVVQDTPVYRMVAFGEYAEDGTASTIKQRDYKDATDLVTTGRPRRLTPLEAERLMSWPDQWTATGVKENGTEYALSDTARYRLCGNGVGSVCVAWFAKRLADLIEAQ